MNGRFFGSHCRFWYSALFRPSSPDFVIAAGTGRQAPRMGAMRTGVRAIRRTESGGRFMNGYEFLPCQFAAMLLAFGVILAIAYIHGKRSKDGRAASPGPGAESAAVRGQACSTAA